MKAVVIAAILASAGAAHADGIDLVPKLGFSVGYGALPIHEENTRATTIGIGVEHPLWGNTRAFGEWEWMWLSDPASSQTLMENPMADTIHGSGQRMLAGLRHTLVVRGDSTLRYFIDGEAGGGAMLADDNTQGTHVNGVGVVGMRVGFDVRNGSSSSRVWELDLGLRAIIVPHDYGMAFGVGMAWGD